MDCDFFDFQNILYMKMYMGVSFRRIKLANKELRILYVIYMCGLDYNYDEFDRL